LRGVHSPTERLEIATVDKFWKLLVELLKTSVECYRRLFAAEPKVRAIHAGLECGLFLEKYPHLEMVSFGPTLRGVHSPTERLEIATVDKFWKLLIEVVSTIQ
jgi:dipeptidase D